MTNNFLDVLQKWTNYMQFSADYSKNTIDSYTVDIEILSKFLRDYSDSEITPLNVTKQNIRAWILYRYENGDVARSVARGLSAVKNFHNFMIKNNLIDKSDVINMRPPRINKTVPRPLNLSQLNELIGIIDYIKNTPWIIKRDKALIILIYSIGLRINEALSLTVSDIINSSGFLEIHGKGGKTRSLPLLDFVKKLLMDYLDCRPHNNSEFLFVNCFGEQLHATSVQKLLKKSRRLLNLSETVTPHAIRHTCATHIMENSGDLRGIQELLGHSLLSSTQIYADITKKYINDIYEKCHPLSKKRKNFT